MENSSGQINLPLLQPPYLVLPPTGVDQPAGPRIKNWRDLGSEHREGKRKKPVVRQLSQGEDEDIRQLHRKLKEICYQNKDSARRDMLPEEIPC